METSTTEFPGDGCPPCRPCSHDEETLLTALEYISGVCGILAVLIAGVCLYARTKPGAVSRFLNGVCCGRKVVRPDHVRRAAEIYAATRSPSPRFEGRSGADRRSLRPPSPFYCVPQDAAPKKPRRRALVPTPEPPAAAAAIDLEPIPLDESSFVFERPLPPLPGRISPSTAIRLETHSPPLAGRNERVPRYARSRSEREARSLHATRDSPKMSDSLRLPKRM